LASSSPCRALIIAPPTLDIVGGAARPGGPALFAGHALAIHGAEPLAYYPHPPWLHETLKAESLAGVERLGAARAECRGPVFRHTYLSGGRRVSELLEPPCTLDPQGVLWAAAAASPRFILYSPLHGEDPGALAALAHRYRVYLDLQGYARAGVEPPRAPVAAAHASSDDYSLAEARALSEALGWLLYTEGEAGGVVLYRGSPAAAIPPPHTVLRDPTGAGDAFTALTAFAVECRGLGVAEAAGWAARSVALALKSLAGALRGAW